MDPDLFRQGIFNVVDFIRIFNILYCASLYARAIDGIN